METINLNKGILNLKNLSVGKNTYIIKCGRKRYYIDVSKDALHTRITKYNFLSCDRKSFSKYSIPADAKTIYFKNNTMLSKTDFMSFDAVSDAIQIINMSMFKNDIII